jgi:hypothetical protein
MLPSELPDAFRALYAADETSGAVADTETPAWDGISLLKSGALKSAEEVKQVIDEGFQKWSGLAAELKEERTLKLTAGSAPGETTLDLGFVVDCTGSMKPFMKIAVAQIKAIGNCFFWAHLLNLLIFILVMMLQSQGRTASSKS